MSNQQTGVSPAVLMFATVSVGIVGFVSGLVIGLSIGVFL